MPKIIQLDKHVSELIAAGEVIERPASIVKELLENSIDAGATSVTVEIQRGGVQYIRITDNGCGIAPEDVPVAFRRHATSKVRNEEDLGKIATLGFRGEAMASICAVSRVELMTKTPENQMGVRYVIQGGEEQESIQVGCPDGTTVIVRDLFYNVPARLKFLKKDVSEANAVQSVVDKIALSHPEVSIKLIRENKTQLHTPGNNDLYSVIYAVFGRDFAKTMMTVDSSYNGTQVKGFISIPMESRSNRSMQHFFVNGRYVKSKTCMAALEEAYKNSIMVGKFPACVLNLSLPYDQVDVNVHPSKIEVRFTNERIVFDGVYFAVKNAIRQQSQLDNAQEVPIKPHVMRSFFAQNDSAQSQTRLSAPGKNMQEESHPLQFAQPDPVYQTASWGKIEKQASAARIPGIIYEDDLPEDVPDAHTQLSSKKDQKDVPENQDIVSCEKKDPQAETEDRPPVSPVLDMPQISSEPPVPKIQEQEKVPATPEEMEIPVIHVIGELFQTYILAETNGMLLIVDKHAAHERILYEKLRAGESPLDKQVLLTPLSITLSREEYEAVLSQQARLDDLGFTVDDFGNGTVLIREVPTLLSGENCRELFCEIAENLRALRRNAAPEALDHLYATMACKAAIKAHDRNDPLELQKLIEDVYKNDAIRYCPHGRPVILTMTKEKFERQFGR